MAAIVHNGHSMNETLNMMQQLTWGVEIECVGLPMARCAEVVASTLRAAGDAHAYACAVGSGYYVPMADGRRWTVVPDGSLRSSPLAGQGMAEVVTPIMRWNDMTLFQNVMRALRAAGARTDSACGQHVHVGMPRGDVKRVQNVVRTAYRYEELITKACGVQSARLGHYCKLTSAAKVEALSRATTERGLNTAWYGEHQSMPSKMDQTRYHGINLNSFFFRGTIEFRWFEGTMHAGEARANVTLALALVAYGITGRTLRPMTREGAANRAAVTPTKAWMSYFLNRLCGLTGPEFKAVTEHLTKKLS